MSMSGTMFVSINKAYTMIKITFITMAFNIILNIMFIPVYSYIGASIMTVITGILGSVLCFHYLSKFIGKVPMKNAVTKPLIATMIMSIFLLLFHENFVLSILIATILYLVLLLAFKTFEKEDFDIFKKLTPRFMRIYLKFI
jgi:O-antigen/teichoic acid export membrane protein